MGVSAIGNYDVAAVPQAMTDAFKRIFAWKFSLSRIPAIGTVLANGKNLHRVSGHRDAFSTACPGRYLYAKLSEIRSGTAAVMGAQGRAPVVKRSAASWADTWYTQYKGVLLRQGSRGSVVRFLQRALKIQHSGTFGRETRAAVVAFQRRQHLPRTGVVTRRVWTRLEGLDFPLVAYRRLTLRQGSRGAAVVAVQRRLGLTPSGVFDSRTGATVAVVQGRNHLTRTGVVSGRTWIAIEKYRPR